MPKEAFKLIATMVVSFAIASVGSMLHEISAAAEARSRELYMQIHLDPGERVVAAAAGNLSDSSTVAIVVGTVLRGDRGRVRVLHEMGGRYRTMWVFTNTLGSFDSAIIRDVNRNGRADLITLWRGGQGGYLSLRVFEWIGKTYRSIWELPPFDNGGQLTAAAQLQIRRIDDLGGVELVIRAANVSPGMSTLGALPRQVSIYRWSNTARTLVLYRRFIDPARSYE